MSARLSALVRTESPGQNLSSIETDCQSAAPTRFASTAPCTETTIAAGGSQVFA
jgi:hypothetical protein